MLVQSTTASPVRVPVDLSELNKVQSDLIRMALLLRYGHQRLSISPDGSSLTVELLQGDRSIDVHTFVRVLSQETA